MDHREHITEIAQEAAKLYGQEWKVLHTGTRERWIETVRHTQRGGGENGMERIAGQAIDDWYKRAEAPPVVEPVPTEEPKKKRGK